MGTPLRIFVEKYKYQYTFDQLCDQLSSIEQKPKETIEEYVKRICLLIWKAKEAAATENEDATYADKVIENLALNHFKNHSDREMSKFLCVKGVQTFDLAVQEVLEEER